MQPILPILVLAFVCSTPLEGQTLTDVPTSHPVYDILNRLEARDIFSRTLPGMRPYSRSQISEWIRRAIENDQVNNRDKQRLSRYSRTISDHPGSLPPGLIDGIAYAYDDTTLKVSVAPLFKQEFHTIGDAEQANERVSQTLIGVAATGSYYRHFAFRIQHFEGREWSNRERLTRSDVARSPIESVQLKGNTVDFRESRYQLSLTLPWLDLDVGKQSFEWGPAREDNIFLQAGTPSFVYSRLRISHKSLTFEHLFGALRTPPEAIELGTTTVDNDHRRSLPSPKRYVAHRIGLSITDRVELGIQESVIYGDRGFEPAYAVPVSILVGAQSYAGDTDNLAFGLDLSYRLRDQAKVYGALFFDDFSKFSPSAFSNQVAIQFGGFWVDPLGLQGLDFRVEYARLEPYTYAHNFDINSYTHFDDVIGHPLGPNSDRVSIEIQGWLGSRVRLAGRLSKAREGDNYLEQGELVNIGGDALQGRRPSDQSVRSFLAGDLNKRMTVSLDAYYEISSALRFRVGGFVRHEERTPEGGNPQPVLTTRSISVTTELNAF
jgi:hypothetical protein